VLEFRALSRRFGPVVALDGLSFTVEPGELCGFLGPNGAGKTTAMRCAVGVTAPDAGEVRWQGSPVDLAVRRRTGYMPEERGLYPRMPVHEQLVYLARLHGMPSAAAARSADHWIDRLGLGDRRDDVVEQLSLGNQQRVQLAAALVHEPELLILDEPFSGLDPLATDVMSAVLRERADAGVAVVFSSHQLDLVEDLCRTVAVIARGRLVLEGSVAALRAAGGRRLRVAVEGSDRWADALPPDLAVVDRRDGTVTVALPADADPDQVLAVARRDGVLIDVHLDQPRLSELFRAAVGGTDADTPDARVPEGGAS
jgi:ABC-2 type transport system ATP-binding protein